MTTAFVLSGGGSLGAVQVGMLRALAERRVAPDLLVGTSAGALNAAFVAAHGTSPAALDLLRGEDVRLSAGGGVRGLLARGAFPAVLPPVRRDGRTLVDGGLADN